jgi:hypothetical protein
MPKNSQHTTKAPGSLSFCINKLYKQPKTLQLQPHTQQTTKQNIQQPKHPHPTEIFR